MNHESKPSGLHQERLIRVFVSSTFRDMQKERDELVLRIFPQLRRLCEERGVTWGEVDLRWGITEEQAERGEVLPICLEEIKRCRPYFIGLLGERYGWIPDTISEEVVEREPWVKMYADDKDKKSVTELEILQGVLNDPAMADHAFFYFRDLQFIDSVPAEERPDFATEDAESQTKLERLKDRIRHEYQAGRLKYEPRENYLDAKALGAQVLSDFTAVIDKLYPEGEQPSLLEREGMDHEVFARSRASVYIGRQEYFDCLDSHVKGTGPPLVVLGESGGGKSALLSNWALRYREERPDDFVLLHFIGGSPNSANATGLLRRIMLELKERFDLPDEVPSQPEKIKEVFPDWLTQTAGKGKVVLVLDALNQLEDVDNAPDLGWLPRVFPITCRVILSTLPGRSLEAIKARVWMEQTPLLEVQPLDEAERRRLIHEFLQQYRRDLGSERTQRLVDASQNSNPLYLRVLLDELRVFGIHEKLSQRIDWYLEARDPYELYRKVIERWEEAYAEGSALVRDTLSLLWAARRGLSETELLEALGQDGQPLPRAAWSPLYLAMADALVTRSGLLTFTHDFLRTATRDMYLPTETEQQQAHRSLAGYFQRHPSWTGRKLDELPWQLANAQEWQLLHEALTAEACFWGLNKRNAFELLGYWVQLKPKFDLAASYTGAFARWGQRHQVGVNTADIANALGEFLYMAGCLSAAELLYRHALGNGEKEYGVNHPEVATYLNNLAVLLTATNKMKEAEPLQRRALTIYEQAYGVEHPHVATALSNLAHLLEDTNQFVEAEVLLRRALAIDERAFGLGNPSVALRLNNLARFLGDTNRLKEAGPMHYRALAIYEQAYGVEHPDTAWGLSHLAIWLFYMNQLGEAEPLFRRGLAIREKVYGNEHQLIASALSDLGELLLATNRLREAEQLQRRALAIDEQVFGPDHPNVARILNNLARVLQAENYLVDAEPLFRRALAINEESLGEGHPLIATALNNLAKLLHKMNRLDEAETLMRRMKKILLKIRVTTGHHHPHMQKFLGNYKVLLQAIGKSHSQIHQELADLLTKDDVSLK